MSGKRRNIERKSSRLVLIRYDPDSDTVLLPTGRISKQDYDNVRSRMPGLKLPETGTLPIFRSVK